MECDATITVLPSDLASSKSARALTSRPSERDRNGPGADTSTSNCSNSARRAARFALSCSGGSCGLAHQGSSGANDSTRSTKGWACGDGTLGKPHITNCAGLLSAICRKSTDVCMTSPMLPRSHAWTTSTRRPRNPVTKAVGSSRAGSAVRTPVLGRTDARLIDNTRKQRTPPRASKAARCGAQRIGPFVRSRSSFVGCQHITQRVMKAEQTRGDDPSSEQQGGDHPARLAWKTLKCERPEQDRTSVAQAVKVLPWIEGAHLYRKATASVVLAIRRIKRRRIAGLLVLSSDLVMRVIRDWKYRDTIDDCGQRSWNANARLPCVDTSHCSHASFDALSVVKRYYLVVLAGCWLSAGTNEGVCKAAALCDILPSQPPHRRSRIVNGAVS